MIHVEDTEIEFDMCRNEEYSKRQMGYGQFLDDTLVMCGGIDLKVWFEWNIVLRDRREGGYGFCKPAGGISSQGSEAPEGWNGSHGLAKNHMPPNRRSRNSIAIEFTK